jgi:signal peptidase I
MRRPSPARMIVTGATIALVLSAWLAFGPRQLGGSVSYVITHGISMQPKIHEGDLVIVRRASTYQHGDVVAYDSPTLRQPVMHRIVDGGPRGWVTKGDNNDWLDSDRPTDADVLGKEWLHIPGAGKYLRQVTSPIGAAVMAVVVGLLLFAGKRTGKKTGERGGAKVMRKLDAQAFFELPPTQQAIGAGLAVICVLSLLLGIASFAKAPVSALSSESVYEHTGEFKYSATAPRGAVYPDGKATTGEPLFLQLVEEVDVTFDYELKSETPAEVTGSTVFWAKVADSSGWKRSFRLQGDTSFGGEKIQLHGTIDPQEIQRLIARVQTETGVIGGSYTVTLMPAVSIRADIGGQAVEERFTPVLNLGLEGQQMRLAATAPETSSDGVPAGDPLRPTKAGSLETSELNANRLSILGLVDLQVSTARWIAFWGLALALGGGYWLLQLLGTRLQTASETERIEARYSQWLIPVDVMRTTNGELVRVSDMDGLARLAERYDRMILHEESRGAHRYYVEEAGVVYCYDPNPPAPASATRTSPPKRIATKSSGTKVRARRASAEVEKETPKPKP